MWWLISGLALAQDDFSEAAEARMGLSFDLDAVQDQIAEPAAEPAAPRAAPSAPPAPYPASPYAPPVPPPTPILAPPLPLEPNSVLETVTVYRGLAIVTRSRDVSVDSGATSVRFEGLPPAIRADGISARVTKGDARIVGLELRSGVGEVEDSERIARVRAEATEAVDKLGAIRDRIEALLAQRAYLRTALVPTGATATPPIRRVRAGLEYAGAAEVRIAERLRKEEEAAKALNEVVVPLLRKLADPLATGREVWVEVESARGGPVAVALEYGVNGATWAPAYNARLDPASGEVALEVFGVVTQTTAEDWTDASILLATADPAPTAGLASLVPWTLGGSGDVGVFDTLDAGAGVTTADGTAAPDAQVVETRMDAQLAGTGVLAIAGERTLRGDGSPQRLPIAVQRLESRVTLTSVPKLAPTVRRRATVRYDGAVPLLPGPVSTFVGSDYVGAGQIGAVVPGEGVELEFGTDDRFRVTRQLVAQDQTRVGRQTTRYDFRFRTTVVNHGQHDAVVAIADQLPRSESVRVVVQALELSGAAPPGEDGLVTWQLPVAAGGRASVDLAFSVTLPDDEAYQANELLVLLLNRR